MSLDPYELKRKIDLGDNNAKKIYPLRRKGNLLLVTLLLGNVAVNAAISILLGSISSGLVAGIVSTALITLFGEIIPQATFSRYALEFGSKMTWIVYIFLIVFFPLCYPIAWLLDKAMGDELPEVYSRGELIKILEEHRHSESSDVMEDEERIANGALTFGSKKVSQVMTPRNHVVAIEAKKVLTRNQIHKLKQSGHSRIPVYKKNLNKVVGLLFMKDLANMKPGAHRALQLADKQVQFISQDSGLDHALNAFIKTKRHMFMVSNPFDEIVGVVTIEDVLEEIIGREIEDEFDENIR
jgi:metal transporter CNNM